MPGLDSHPLSQAWPGPTRMTSFLFAMPASEGGNRCPRPGARGQECGRADVKACPSSGKSGWEGFPAAAQPLIPGLSGGRTSPSGARRPSFLCWTWRGCIRPDPDTAATLGRSPPFHTPVPRLQNGDGHASLSPFIPQVHVTGPSLPRLRVVGLLSLACLAGGPGRERRPRSQHRARGIFGGGCGEVSQHWL